MRSRSKGTENGSLQAELERRQDEVLAKLDELDAQILALLDEFTVRLRGETDQLDNESADQPHEKAA